MPDSIYNFGCTFSVRKSEKCTMTDMELAQSVLQYMKESLHPQAGMYYHIVVESIHPIMVGPEGGTPVE